MVKKLLLRTAILAAAVGIPVAYFVGSDYWKAARNTWSSSPETTAASASAPMASPHTSTSGALVAEPGATSIEGSPVGDLAEVFRFDVTTDWILRRWPRVSTGLAEIQLQGYRVPLMTGSVFPRPISAGNRDTVRGSGD